MKKIIFAIVLIAVALVIAAPYANGLIMEKVAQKVSTDLNQFYGDSGSDITIEIVDHQRNFSSSQIKWKIGLGKLAPLYGIEAITIVEQAQHGYTGVVSKASLMENQWYADFVNHQLNGNNPLDITMRYHLSGKIASEAHLAAFSVNGKAGRVAVKPGTLKVAGSNGFQAFTSNGSWGGMEIADQLKVDGIAIDADMQQHSTYIWTGKGSITIGRCQAAIENDRMEMADLACNYNMTYAESDQTVSMGLDYGAGQVAFEGGRIDNASVRLNFNKMDAQGYEALMKLYTQVVNESMDALANAENDPEQANAAMQQQMMMKSLQIVSAIEKLLKDGFEIEVSDLKASLPEGDIKGDMAISLKKDMTMAQFLPMMADPKLALDLIALRTDISLPATLVEDKPGLLSPNHPGMPTGVFEVKGAQAVHKAETKDGKLFLNGQEVILN